MRDLPNQFIILFWTILYMKRIRRRSIGTMARQVNADLFFTTENTETTEIFLIADYTDFKDLF